MNPTLIVEVLSKSTSEYDRGEKFRCYRSIPSFREYWLVDQCQIQVEQFSKMSEEAWMFRAYERSDAVLESSDLGIKISVSDLYEDVSF